MSVHPRGDRSGWVVRWRDADGRQHSRSFTNRKEAARLDAEVRAVKQNERRIAQKREIDQSLENVLIESLGDDPTALRVLADRIRQRADELETAQGADR